MNGLRMYYLKRILGLPGERIELRNGKLYIDREFVDEPHVIYQGGWSMEERELASDEFFIAGDNRSMSMAFHKMGVTQRHHNEEWHAIDVRWLKVGRHWEISNICSLESSEHP